MVGWIEANLNISVTFTKRLSDMQREELFGDYTY